MKAEKQKYLGRIRIPTAKGGFAYKPRKGKGSYNRRRLKSELRRNGD